jgi:hypothetical protein
MSLPPEPAPGGSKMTVWLCLHNHRFLVFGPVYYDPTTKILWQGYEQLWSKPTKPSYDFMAYFCSCGQRPKKQASVKADLVLAAKAAALIGGRPAAQLILKTPIAATRLHRLTCLPPSSVEKRIPRIPYGSWPFAAVD